MIQAKYILTFLMLMAAGMAHAQVPALAVSAAHDKQWVSYRDAYRSMLWFEKYGKPKNLIQNHFQISPKDKTVASDSLHLSLSSKSTNMALPLDATGRTVFPLLKSLYDENAELLINQKAEQYFFRSRVSLAIRHDGVYEAADLRAACEQVLAYQAYLDSATVSGKKCVGVRIAFLKKENNTLVEFRSADRNVVALPVGAGSVFWDETNDRFRIVNYLFSAWPEKGQLITHTAPLALSALFE